MVSSGTSSGAVALTPPSSGDITRGPAIVAVAATSLVVAILCVLLRSYIRIRMTKTFWWDDGLLILGLLIRFELFSIVGVIFNIIMYYLSKEQSAMVLKYNTLFAAMNVPGVCLVKTSILVFILRLQASRRMALTVYGLLLYTIVVGGGISIFMWVQCVPFNALWDKSVKGTCISREAYSKVSIAQRVLYSALDLFITSLPVMILWNVQMRRRLKVGISFLLSLGLGATAFNIMRVVMHKQLAASDFTFDLWGVDISAQLEQNICIIAAALPTYPHLFRIWARKFREKTQKESSKKSANFMMRSFSRRPQAESGKKHPYDDITDLSNITVQRDFEQRSSHGEIFTEHVSDERDVSTGGQVNVVHTSSQPQKYEI
ncbi:hypothetical protein BDV95DRAFT_595687 [Massariosphaeria phaeospora]|uniref:Rhodopsin domain-containing protein n=1 Tax=Massariosphaeria phaeospora TaxID=100035 RepID=A0A7C8I7J1_9PLEO|nr:hypothetical protein BDV95DRAFT_595687 [Massariosphaeria phaeospora]